ncbi:hypothetical protein J2S58_002971 [Nakamurella flavida]|uniref:DUF5926 family protein n=1 Tax=Nakamurella flavida TaxID=363630 RepID=UPI0027884857|nr:DUF5926 family protein [Nakamurella flavida]MDP9779348.1 hypothetical protein [Nakamurella flavida]
MSKKTARRAAASPAGSATLTAESPRRPCPCGSGRRYKACHGGSDPADLIVSRPFAGLAAETELIALREFVPSATAPLTLRAAAASADDAAAPDGAGTLPTPSVTLATVLPGAAAALTRSDGSVLLGLQVQTHSGDLARDLATALEWALAAEPSSVLAVVGRATLGPRWADLVVDEPLQVTVHEDFGWWLESDPEPGSEVAASLERANGAVMPSAKIADLPGAYWVDTGDKAHLRWVRPEDEQTLMAALARVAAAGELDLGEGTRYVGSFRAHGCLVPVWDLDRDAHPSEWTEPVRAFAARLEVALASDEPLTDAQRRARDGILGRQFTLR